MQNSSSSYDLIVVGAGAAGMMAAITAARRGNRVVLLEKLGSVGAKLKATGGGRCNLTNTLPNAEFMARFGRDGRFMGPALDLLDHRALIRFFANLGVESHAPDGYRVFPLSHSALSIIGALVGELERLGVEIVCSSRVQRVLIDENRVSGVETQHGSYRAPHVIVATGGLGYPQLGAEGDGYAIASELGHTVTDLYPAMMPLKTKEEWVAHCRADTIPKAEIRVDLPKKNLKAKGDLIFTAHGIRGPVVLDFAREINPLLERYGEVPLLINLTKGMNEEQIRHHLKERMHDDPHGSVLTHLQPLLPESVAQELCGLADADPDLGFNRQSGPVRDRLIRFLAWTPLTVTGHDGFKMAMITRGGVSLKDIRPETMESRLVRGLFFCGEVMNLDGPCGGYNLQFSFASGHLAGLLQTRSD